MLLALLMTLPCVGQVADSLAGEHVAVLDSTHQSIPVSSDSAALVSVLPDSMPPDSTQASPEKKSEIEDPIYYEAEIIENFIKEKRTILEGDAKVEYQDITLKAHKITVDWNAKEMLAEGIWDTVWVYTEEGDSTRKPKLKDFPEFKEGSDEMTGEVMVFNFETKKGRVLRGRTAYEDGYYGGKALKMVKSRTFHVSDANYSTCDKEEDPHFHIHAKRMKILVDDKMIAKPIVLHVGKIPLLPLPFVVFPIQRGRHSGFLIPKYGVSSTEGRYLRGIGYYWAPSEFWDIKNELDFFEKSGILMRSKANYQVKYKLRGSISGSWTRKDFEAFDRQERRWDLNVNHAQEITPTTRLTVNATLISSGSFYRELSTSREHRLRNEIRSNAKLTQRWGRSGNVEMYLNQTRQIQQKDDAGNPLDDNVSLTLPQIRVSNRITSLIPKAKSRGRNTKWYQSIQIPYSVNAQVLRESRDRNEKNYSTGMYDRVKTSREGIGVDHSLRFYVNPKLFGWLTLKPSLNVDQSLYDRRKVYFLNPETNTVEEEEERGFYHLTTYNTSLSLNTKVYGVFRSRHVENMIVRHVMTPNVSFSFRPDFSKSEYGYYQTVIDTSGKKIFKDHFSESLYGGTPRSESQSMNMSVQNLFQMKLGEGEDTKKFDLFTWNLSSSYNWKAEQYKLADLRSRIQANPTRQIGVNMNATHSFYKTDDSGSKIDKMFVDDVDWSDLNSLRDFRLGRMTQFGANMDFRFKGKFKSSGEGGDESNEALEEQDSDGLAIDPMAGDLESVRNMQRDRFDMEEDVGPMEIPWNLNARLSYTENRSRPDDVTKKFWVQTNIDFNLTRHWKISYRSRWDLEEKKAVSQDFVFYRDLHCWEARFTLTPTGPYKRFYFKINVKASMLKELKFEKGSGRSGLYGY